MSSDINMIMFLSFAAINLILLPFIFLRYNLSGNLETLFAL